MFDAVIVGAGPAGASCALWLKQLGFKPVVIDKNTTCGGLQLRNPRENTWIAAIQNASGADLARAMHANMLKHSVELRMQNEVTTATVTDRVCVVMKSGEIIDSKVLVLATGVVPKTGGLAARIGMLLGDGHRVANTNFLGAKVAILGGGDNAFENYGFTLNRGAASVRIFARTLRARAEQLEQVPPEHVTVGRYVVDADKNTVNGEVFDQILVLYGYEVSAQGLLGLDLAMRPDGHVSTDANCQTSNPRVYAIGEVAKRMHPCCITSMADGVTAAKAVQRQLESTAVLRYSGLVRRAAALI